MSQQVQRRRVGDTLTVLSATLQQPDSTGAIAAKNLTGLTVTFTMVNLATGAVKVAPASATVETAASGTVYYRFAAGDVDTAGKFGASFIVTDGGRTDHFPVAQEGCIVLIDSDTQTAEEAYREAVG
jgi:hypothetical protein